MSEQSLELLRRIRRRLAGTARRMTMADLYFGLAVSLGVAATVWILSVAVEAGFWLDTTSRTFLFWVVLAFLVALFAFFVLRPLLRLSGVLVGPSPESVARRVGSHFPEIGDRLTNLLDLSEGRRSDAPDSLIDGAVRMLGRQVETVEFEKVETYSKARRAVRFAAIPLVSLLLFVAAAPTVFVDASKRLFSPGMTFHAPAPFLLVVEPGDQEVARGTSTEIRIRAEGQEQPRTVTLSYNNLDEEHIEEVRLSADSSGVFRHRFANVRQSFRYRASAAPVTSEWYRTEVTEHPLVRGMQVTLDFPSYSGIPPQRLDPNIGDVSGLPGSRVNLELDIGGSAVDEAFVLFDDGATHPLEVDNNRASGSFQLTREGNYQVVLKNVQGIQNRDPIAYAMSLIADAAPSIMLVHPEADAMLGEDLQSLLVARMSDDYGFRDLRLHYRLAESRFGDPSEEFDSDAVPLPDPAQLDQEVRFDWQVPQSTGLDPVPGDVIEYFLEVRDNDTYSGFKSARTPVHRLRLPSLAEQYEQIEKEQDDVEDRMEEMMRNADQVREQFQELRDELRRKQDADWEDKRQLDQIEERQRQLEEQTTQLSEQLESMNRSMEQNNLLSSETMEMYQEMQKVVEEINSPELMDALRQLQESIQELNMQQMQQAVEDFEFSEEQYQQRLERALELFKNLRTQQALEEASRRAEEIARQQERLAEQTKEFLEEQADKRRENATEDPSSEREEQTEPGQDSESEEEGEEGDTRKEGDTGEEGEQGEQDPQNNDRASEQSDATESEESESENGASPEGENREPSSPEKLAAEQERSKEEMEQLEALLDQIREQMDELQKGPKEEMQQLNESVQQQQIPQQMQDNADQIRQQQMQEAQQGQQQMQQQLQQLQQQLSEMQTGMQGRQMEMNVAGLRRALSDVLTLSQKQEELRRSLRNTASESPSLREDARGQVELSEGLATVIDTLHTLAKNIPQMSREVQRQSGEAVRQMSRATDAMTERAVDQAAGYQKASMMHLNELALMLSDVMNQMMNASGSGSGSTSMQQMIQQMQQMAGQQQQLNQQIQQFLNDVQGNRLSVDMQERLQQMSSQQQSIKQQLDQLRRNPEARGRLLGDLEKIGDQMEETIGELERRQMKPEMIERQQQILQRLLDAQRSIHQRGEEEKREGHEGRDIIRESPGELPPEEAADKLRRDLIKALESGYAPDYEDLIKRYFELLQNQTLQED